MKKFLFYLVQFTWALPQNLVGGIGFLALRKKYKHERFNNAFVTYVPHDNFGGVSLGIFIFMNPDRPADRVHDTRMHEYGHTIQSLLLGLGFCDSDTVVYLVQRPQFRQNAQRGRCIIL